MDDLNDAPNGASDQTATPEPQEQPSLRDTIEAAVAKQREPAQEKNESDPAKEQKAEGERTRDEQGRFAKSVEAKVEEPKEKAAPEPSAEAPKTETEAQPALKPPTSWSPTAKVAFDKLPPEVQQAVAKREEEINAGFAKFQEYKPIEPFIKMAKDSGTTLDQALNRYIAAERALQQDFVSGTVQLAQQQGVNPVALAHAILARHGVAPQQGEAGQQQPHQPARVDLSPIEQKLSALESYIQEQQQAGVQSEITRFASDPKNVFFENVKADMGRLIESGQAETLEDAYDKACWANKEIRALLIKQQSVPSAKADDAVQRAKAADKATGGAPSPGMKTDAPLVKAGASIRDTIRAAVNAQRGI